MGDADRYDPWVEHESPESGVPDGRPIKARTALLVVGLAEVLVRRQPRDRPEAVSLGSKGRAVLDRANELALEGREDDRAVSELVILAGGKRRTLRQARQASRFGGLHHEHRHANRVYRMLDAACSGGNVGAVDEVDSRRIEEVEAMMALPRHERWALLVDREPRLLEVENEVRRGAFGRLRSADQSRGITTGESRIGADGKPMHAVRSVDGPHTQAEIQALSETANNMKMLHKRTAVLLGPDSGQRDLLLGSTRAQQAAEGYLLRSQE